MININKKLYKINTININNRDTSFTLNATQHIKDVRSRPDEFNYDRAIRQLGGARK